MKHLLFLLFALTATLRANEAAGQQKFDPSHAHYLWPTEASPFLSSTFGETRSAHFHAALDIKTWGQRGYEVYATRDGIVDRIGIGPTGYGKVVYLKHDDGSYSVYAHLMSFNSDLQQLADSIRFANNYQFELNRYLGWKNIKVKQGQVLGYSGASGIGPPHLHFELRTPSRKPFNPLLTNLSVKDNIAPRISGISIEPLSRESSIEGENKIYTQRSWGKKKIYNFGTVDVSGPVGLGINAFDQSNGVYNSYAVYELSMSVNGKQLFKSKVDSFSYRETDQMFIDRVYPILQQSNRGFQRLFVADGNTLPFYEADPKKGVLDLKPGKHPVTILATDYYGNQSSAKVTLNVTTADKKSRRTKISSEDQSIAPLHKWKWFSDWVSLTNQQYNQLTIGLADSSSFSFHSEGVAVDLSGRNPLFMNIPQVGPTLWYRLSPRSEKVVTSEDLNSMALFPKQAVYDTVSVAMIVNHSAGSYSLELLPEAYPLRKAFTFYVPREPSLADSAKWSFYRLNREDMELEMIPTVFEEKHIRGQSESLGRFELKQDTTAPQLFNPRLTKRPDGQWLVMIDAVDDLSGIDYSKTIIIVNGKRGIAEFEPEDDRFVYYHPNFSPSQSTKVEITAFDKMGNKKVDTFQIGKKRIKK